ESAGEAITRAGFGWEGGGTFSWAAWRACVEALYARREGSPRGVPEGWGYRFAGALRLHSLLSIQAGFVPRLETASLGVRFGFGDWEGFSAMRRHEALGGTSLQGLRWQRF